MEIGARSKVVAANRMNARSSRSHTLFQVTVKRTVRPACPSLQLPDIILKVPAWVNRFVTHCLNPRRFHRGQMLVPWRESYLHSSRSWTWRAPSGRQKPSLVRRHAPCGLVRCRLATSSHYRDRADGLALQEAKDINKSLAALGNVVSALSKRSRYVV